MRYLLKTKSNTIRTINNKKLIDLFKALGIGLPLPLPKPPPLFAEVTVFFEEEVRVVDEADTEAFEVFEVAS